MKKILAIALAAMMLLSVTALADDGALDAFADLAASAAAKNSGRTSDEYLDQVMADAFAAEVTDVAAAAKLAPELQGLASVTTKDIAVYSATHQINGELVRNKYYRALANVLKAEIMVNPAAGEKYQSLDVILNLFLSGAEDDVSRATRTVLRSTITKDYTRAIAQEYNVPASFIEFILMDDDWDDDDYRNDEDWKTNAAWNTNDFTPDSLDQYLGADGIANTFNTVDLYTPDYNTPNTPDYNTPNTPDYNTPNTPDYNTPNTPDYNTPNTPDYNTPNTPDYNTPNTPDYNTPNTPDYNTPNSPDSPDR